MFQLPFHDGRSFALYLKERAKNKGLSMYQVFEAGVIDKKLYRRYEKNIREPKISTVSEILMRIDGVIGSGSTQTFLNEAA